MKSLIKWLVLGLMMVSGGVFAQTPCAGGGYVDMQGVCQNSAYGPHSYGSHSEDYGTQPSGASAPPRRVVRDSFGAVAVDGSAGAYGYASNQLSKQASKQAAIADCLSSGGQNCKIRITYRNSCVAYAFGTKSSGGYSSFSTNPSLETAQNQAVQNCNSNANSCQILVSECSLPQ